MADTLLNGRPAEDFGLAAIAHGRECDLARDLESLAGLLPCGRCGNHGHQAEGCTRGPKPSAAVPRPVTDLPVLR
jgi:hypothetical protein